MLQKISFIFLVISGASIHSLAQTVPTCSMNEIKSKIDSKFSSAQMVIAAISQLEKNMSCKFAPVDCTGRGFGVMVGGKDGFDSSTLTRVEVYPRVGESAFGNQKQIMAELITARICQPVKPRPCVAETQSDGTVNFDGNITQNPNHFEFDKGLLDIQPNSSTLNFQYSWDSHFPEKLTEIYIPSGGSSVAERLLKEGACSVILNIPHIKVYSRTKTSNDDRVRCADSNGNGGINFSPSPVWPMDPVLDMISVTVRTGPTKYDFDYTFYQNTYGAMWLDSTGQNVHYSYVFSKRDVYLRQVRGETSFPQNARLDYVIELGKTNPISETAYKVTPFYLTGLDQKENPKDYKVDIHCN